MIQAIEEGSECYQHVDHRPYVEIVRSFGGPGLEVVADVLRAQVDATEETIACYCAILVIESRLPGRVGIILEAIRLPYRSGMVREELLDTVFDHVHYDVDFFGNADFVSEVRKLEPKYPWVEEQIARLLKAGADSGLITDET